MALAAVYQGIPEETLMVIAEKQTAKEAWETLKTMHLGVDRVRNAKVQTLKSEFELLRMKESDNVDDFSMKLTGVVNKIRALGGKMQDSYVVSKLLRAVPERFLTIVSTIEQFGNIDSMSLEEAIGRLKAHEERARVFQDNVDYNLLLTHAGWQAVPRRIATAVDEVAHVEPVARVATARRAAVARQAAAEAREARLAAVARWAAEEARVARLAKGLLAAKEDIPEAVSATAAQVPGGRE